MKAGFMPGRMHHPPPSDVAVSPRPGIAFDVQFTATPCYDSVRVSCGVKLIRMSSLKVSGMGRLEESG